MTWREFVGDDFEHAARKAFWTSVETFLSSGTIITLSGLEKPILYAGVISAGSAGLAVLRTYASRQVAESAYSNAPDLNYMD